MRGAKGGGGISGCTTDGRGRKEAAAKPKDSEIVSKESCGRTEAVANLAEGWEGEAAVPRATQDSATARMSPPSSCHQEA